MSMIRVPVRPLSDKPIVISKKDSHSDGDSATTMGVFSSVVFDTRVDNVVFDDDP